MTFTRGGGGLGDWQLFSSSSVSPDETSAGDKSASLKEHVERSTAIASSTAVNSFGGLNFRDSVDRARVLFVLGGPGAGKGTQSEMLLENYPCVHLSAGQLLRSEVKKPDSPHAALIEDCLVSGKIVPVDISLSLLQNAMTESSGKSLIFLVDGFPRNFDNLEGWARRMPAVSDVEGVLFYECPLDVLERRILERAKESGRSDDNIESLRKRFNTFETQTMPVIETLRLIGEDTPLNVYSIRGDQTIEKVWEDTQQVMNEVLASDILAANSKLLDSIKANDADRYRSLCGKEFFDTLSADEVINSQELGMELESFSVSNAKMEFLTGSKVNLTYDLSSEAQKFRENRIWSHQGNGWVMVHFFREPLE